MANCKACKKHFHACSSCGLRGYEWHYCNDACYTKDGSPEYCYDCEQPIQECFCHEDPQKEP